MTGNWLRGLGGATALAVLVTAVPVAAQKSGKETFEVFQDAKKEWRWRFKAANGKIIATPGEGYKAKSSCEDAIQSIQMIGTSKMKAEFYEDAKKEYRWRLKSPANDKIMAVSSEGYKAKDGAEKGFEVFRKGAPFAGVVLVEKTDK